MEVEEHLDSPLTESIFELKTDKLSLEVEEDSTYVIVRSIYLSVDPYQINRMKKCNSSATLRRTLKEIESFGVGRVVASGNDAFKKDDIVSGLLSWSDYTVVRPGIMLKKVEVTEFPLTYQMGALGTIGLTAYGALYRVCKPKKGEKVFVSTASGSVCNLVGQFRKA